MRVGYTRSHTSRAKRQHCQPAWASRHYYRCTRWSSTLPTDGVPVTVTCRVLGFSTQAFYKWRKAPLTQRDWDDAHLINAALDIHADDPAFGYRFIADELPGRGITASENRVARLCSQERIWSIFAKKRGLNRRSGPPVHDDLVDRQFCAQAANEVWLTDITEHRTAWILTVVATWAVYPCSSKAVNRSAGLSQPSVLRGRVSSCSATAARSVTLCCDRSVPFGKYCRRSPFQPVQLTLSIVVAIPVSRILHIRQYLCRPILYDPSIGVDTPTIKLADSLVPVLSRAFVDTDPRGSVASAHPFAAQPQELVALITDVLAGEDPRLMRPLVARHPHVAEFSGHRRDISPNAEQPKELVLFSAVVAMLSEQAEAWCQKGKRR